jgi:hypothetical protein
MFGNSQCKRRLDVRAFPMKRAALTAIAVAMVLLTIGVSPTWAQPTTTICVPENTSTPVISGTSEGTCTKPKYNALRLPGPEGLATLNKILPHLKFQEEGVGGKPTIQVTGANVQIINGMGHSDTTNGAGNLVIGYDERCDLEPEPPPSTCKPPEPPVDPKLQTGSHNLVVGDAHRYTSWGSIIGGFGGSVDSPGAIMGGAGNHAAATAQDAFLVGGGNEVSSFAGSVSGGERNRVKGPLASVSGGRENTASGQKSSVTGGEQNKALGFAASVSGGDENTARAGTIVGGQENEVAERGERAAILGGQFNVASGLESAVLGGQSNKANGDQSSVSGGNFNTANGKYSSIGGGWNNEVRFKPFTAGEEGMWAAIFGGKENITAKDYDAIP